jgi:hypothetical protein
MDWVSFGLLLNEHLGLFAGILVVSIVFYTLIFRRFYISILDPVLFAVLFSVFGFAVVWFLYFAGSIEPKYLASYLLTQIAFWLGLFSFKSLKKRQLISPYKPIIFQDQQLFEKVFFLVTSLLYLFGQLLSYQVIGIPLLLGTHIDVYNNSGGWGMLGRILDVVKPCAIFMLIYFLFKVNTSFFITIYKYFFLAVIILFFALSGSKGEFMSLGFIIFCFLLLNAVSYKKQFLKINKYGVIILGVGVVFALLTIVVQPGGIGEGQTTTEVFLFRFVASGDTYFFVYPNNNIEHISHAQPFLALFGDIFSTVRIIPREKQPVVLGVQLFRMFSDLDITAGPNARHNVFGYVYYGFYGSIVFSYLIGLTLSFVRNKLYFSLRRNILGQIGFVLLYINLAGIETDPPQAVSNLENVLLILPFILFISISFFVLLMKNKTLSNLNTA